jgi:hypothetical protein
MLQSHWLVSLMTPPSSLARHDFRRILPYIRRPPEHDLDQQQRKTRRLDILTAAAITNAQIAPIAAAKSTHVSGIHRLCDPPKLIPKINTHEFHALPAARDTST